MANRVLGIHFSSKEIKLAELEIQPKTKEYRVLNWAIDYIPALKTEENQLKALSEALKKNNIISRQAVVVVSDPALEYKLIELPVLPEKEVNSALEFKIASAFPFAAENAVVDYYKVGELQAAGKQMFFVAAIPKEYIMNVIRVMKKAGIKIVDIVASSSVLSGAAPVSDKDPLSLVYLGKYSTLIVLAKHGQVVFAREVQVGGENITQAMVGVVQTEAGRIEMDAAKAEEVKSKFGIPVDLEAYTAEANLPASEIMGMMRPALEKLVEEILRTFAYYRETTGDQAEFKKTYFTGGVSKTKNLLLHFANALGMAVELLPQTITSPNKDFSEYAPFLTLAISAALQKKPCVNLFPSELKYYAYGSAFKRLTNIYLDLAVFVLFLGLVFGVFFSKQMSLQSKLNVIQQQISRLEEAKRGGVEQQMPAVQKMMQQLGVKGKTDRFIKIIGYIHRNTPKGIYYQRISYDRTSGQMVVSGVIMKDRHKSRLSQLIDNFKAGKYFSSIDVSYFKKSEAYTVPAYEFEVRCAMAGDI